MNIKCKDCESVIFTDDKWTHWRKLFNYFEHQYNEGEISDKSFEDLIDTLVWLKPPMEE